MKGMKRPLAIVCLVLIGFLAVMALVLAVIGTETALRLLMADLFCLIAVPVAFYGYQMILKWIVDGKGEKEGEEES